MRFHLSQEAKDHRLCEIPVSPWHGASARSRVNADRRMSPPTPHSWHTPRHISNMVMTAVVPGRFLGGHILRRIAVTHRPPGYLRGIDKPTIWSGQQLPAQYLVRASRAVGSLRIHAAAVRAIGDAMCTSGGRLCFRSTTMSRNAFVQFGLLALLAGGISKAGQEDKGLSVVSIDTSGCSRSIDPQILAHELSGPVSALNVLTSMLADRDLTPDAHEEIATTIKGELQVLKALIADVERLTPSASGPFTVLIRSTQVVDIFRQTALYVRTIKPDVALAIDCPPGLHVLADPHRIQQVLRNLLINAMRYTRPGAPIELHATLDHDVVHIQVIDQGPGISPRLVPLIFNKRVRGPEGDSTLAQGRGLGLFICREIVEAHGSHLQVHSTVHRGTTFSFDLRTADD